MTSPRPIDPAAADTPVVSIVVPTYKEAANLRPLAQRIAAAMAPTGRSYEVVIVDDNSRDGTIDIVAELEKSGLPVRLITRTNERGLSSAVVEGFKQARGELLVCMDADLSHPPEALPTLVDVIDEDGAELVIGSRYVEGGGTEADWGAFRWLNSKVATLMARPFTKARDPMAGFFALSRAVFERADGLSPIGYKIGLELIVKCDCRDVREVPIQFADRKLGESKLSLKEQLNYLKHLKRLADYEYGGVIGAVWAGLSGGKRHEPTRG
jgi:dolichol-phosphate mannosyltransferase